MAYTVLVSSLVRTVDALPVPDPPPVIIPGDPEIPPVTPTPKPPVKKPIGPVPDPTPPCLTIQAYMQALSTGYYDEGGVWHTRSSAEILAQTPLCGGLKV